MVVLTMMRSRWQLYLSKNIFLSHWNGRSWVIYSCTSWHVSIQSKVRWHQHSMGRQHLIARRAVHLRGAGGGEVWTPHDNDNDSASSSGLKHWKRPTVGSTKRRQEGENIFKMFCNFSILSVHLIAVHEMHFNAMLNARSWSHPFKHSLFVEPPSYFLRDGECCPARGGTCDMPVIPY